MCMSELWFDADDEGLIAAAVMGTVNDFVDTVEFDRARA